jgi:integrase
MKLEDLVERYFMYKESFGERFNKKSRYLLKQFVREIGTDTTVENVSKEMVLNFLNGKTEEITGTWFVKQRALGNLFKYAISRGYINTSPLPDFSPQKPTRFIPYIYSDGELKRLFDSALTYQRGPTPTDPHMIRTILILTYTLGLRRRETLLIKFKDIDMKKCTILIEQSKYYKTRYVTFNRQVGDVIFNYLSRRKGMGLPQSPDDYLFIGKKGKPFRGSLLDVIFSKIRTEAGIRREDGAAYQPRIYDLRHTFATKRLISWYEEGKDVQQLLPVLSTFLGHQCLAYTSVYLSMTDKLLEEANNKFNNYVNKHLL